MYPTFKALFAGCLLAGLLYGTAFATEAEARYNSGVILYREGQYKQALDAFEDAGRGLSQSQELAYYKALCYAQLGRNDDARKAYQAVIALGADTEAGALAKEGLSYLPDPKALDRPPAPPQAQQVQQQAANSPQQQQANPFGGMDAKTMQMMMMMNSMGGGGGSSSMMMLPMMQQMMQGQNGTPTNGNDPNAFSPEAMKTMIMQEMMQNVDLFGSSKKDND